MQNWLFQMQPPCHIVFRLFVVFSLSYSDISSPIGYKVLNQMCIYLPQLMLSFPCFYRPGNFLTKHYRKFLYLKFHKVWIKYRNLLSEAFIPKTQLLDCLSGDLLRKRRCISSIEEDSLFSFGKESKQNGLCWPCPSFLWYEAQRRGDLVSVSHQLCRRALLSGRKSNLAEGKWGETLTWECQGKTGRNQDVK